MAIKIVKEVQNKESAKDNITSAKGTYPALIILPKTELDAVNELRISENKALCSDPTSAGSYYVWFWCPSVDGKYETDNRQYNRVNVPKYNEEGTELKYVVGDVIDISFDDGDISAPRFIRLWGLINNDEGKDSVSSNVVGIKTGNFPSILPDALDMASNQVGTAAYNLYPYLYKILTGRMMESPTDFSDYSSYSTDSVWFEVFGSGNGYSTLEVINSRFKQGILPFSSKWSSAYPFKESELDDFNPFDHRSRHLSLDTSKSSASPTRHLNPYWNFDDDRQDISYIKNFIMFFKTIAEKSGKEKSKTEAMEILQVLKSEIESSTTNDKDIDINKEEMFEELVDQFSRGINPTFEGPKKSKSTNNIETKKVLDSYSKHGQIMRSATMTYLIAILNLAVSYFQGAEIHNYFDVLVYVSLYPYVRHFYGKTITLDDNLSMPTIDNKDFQTMSVGLLSNKIVFNKIRKWAIKYVTVAQDEETVKVGILDAIKGFFNQIKDFITKEAGKEADKIANNVMQIINEVRKYYFKLSNIEEKRTLLKSWLQIFIEDGDEDKKITQAKDRLDFIVTMINKDENFLNKVNDITNGTEGKVQSTGTFKWPVPEAKIENITSGFSGSEIYNPDPDRTDHNGIDIAMPEGTPIVAADNGIVTRADNNVRGFVEGSYGNMVKIDHGNSFTTLYGHMVEGSVLVKVDQRVSKGEKIGEVGNTGCSTGNHLHFTIYQGSIEVDPMKYFYGALDEESQDEVSLVPDPYPERVFNSFESLVALGFSTPIYKFIKDLAEIDSNGLVKIGDYYCVAMGSFYRNSKNKNTWGSLYEITTEHGQRYKVVTTDTKSDTETDPKHQYHKEGDNSIVEFLVNEDCRGKQAWEGPIYKRTADIINTQFPWKGKITSIKEIGVHPNAKNYRW